MEAAAPEPFFDPDPVEVRIGFGAPRPHDRVTVAFRGLLAVPHLVVLFVLELVSVPLLVLGWFAALILGRLPRWIASYEIALIAYSIRVNSYVYMLAGEFPPFSLSRGDYPVKVEIGASRLSRLKVLFRLLLAIPAAIASAVVGNGLIVLSPVIWLCTLLLGRTPAPLFGAAAAITRYQARYQAYMALVTDEYPRRVFGDRDMDWAPEGMRVSAPAALMWLIVVLGLVWMIGGRVIVSDLLNRPGPAAAAINRLNDASFAFQQTVAQCPGGGAGRLVCFEHAERAWSGAWSRFATEFSKISFSVSQQAQAAATLRDAREIARDLLAASKAKTVAAYGAAYANIPAEARRFTSDSRGLY